MGSREVTVKLWSDRVIRTIMQRTVAKIIGATQYLLGENKARQQRVEVQTHAGNSCVTMVVCGRNKKMHRVHLKVRRRKCAITGWATVSNTP